MDAPILRFDPQHRIVRHTVPATPAVSLSITRGRVQRRIRNVSGPVFLIGTSHDCDLVLGDLRFPESYAYLFVQPQKVTLRWLGAGPALLVCGEAADSAELGDGDTISFGPFELQISVRPIAGSGQWTPRLKTGSVDWGA